MKNYILALDQGTTSSRAIVYDHDVRQVAMAQREHRQIYPQPGWVEHDAEEIWATQSKVMAEVLAEIDGGSESIAAIGITNQRETTVVWDKVSGEPVYNAIVWQDRRTADFCRTLRDEGAEEKFRKITGLRLDPYFSGTKLRWILDHVDGARERAENGDLLFGTIDSWLVWKFTGGKVHVTDETNACRTLLYDLEAKEWSDELLDRLKIPRAMMPEIRGCSEIYGETAEHGIPIAGIAGDQHAALFGQACFEPGMAKNTYGTGCFLLMHTGEKAIRSENNLLTTVAWQIDGVTEYALEGSIFMGGAIVQWLRDEMGLIETARQCDVLAAEVEDNGGLILVPAFSGLGAPHWDPYARGVAIGMTRGTNKKHFCRAALEAIAQQSNDLAACMVRDSGMGLKQLRVDGGATRSDLLMQIQADLMGVEVLRPKSTETTAMGAAYLAGLAVGFWKSREEIAGHWELNRGFKPSMNEQTVTTMTRQWHRAVERAKGWEGGSE